MVGCSEASFSGGTARREEGLRRLTLGLGSEFVGSNRRFMSRDRENGRPPTILCICTWRKPGWVWRRVRRQKKRRQSPTSAPPPHQPSPLSLSEAGGRRTKDRSRVDLPVSAPLLSRCVERAAPSSLHQRPTLRVVKVVTHTRHGVQSGIRIAASFWNDSPFRR